jgi:hypothetical protein
LAHADTGTHLTIHTKTPPDETFLFAYTYGCIAGASPHVAAVHTLAHLQNAHLLGSGLCVASIDGLQLQTAGYAPATGCARGAYRPPHLEAAVDVASLAPLPATAAPGTPLHPGAIHELGSATVPREHTGTCMPREHMQLARNGVESPTACPAAPSNQ